MDWEQLEELSIKWAHNPELVLVQEMARSGRLKNLKSLDVASLEVIKALDNNTLTQLRWVGRTAEGGLESILAHQGQSLRKLEYRCDEAMCPEFIQPFNVSTFPALAPNLEYISINVPRNGSLPFGDMKALASIPNLQKANLFFRMQSDCHAKEEALGVVPDCMWSPEKDDSEICNGTARYHLPYINRTTAEDVFNLIRNHKQGKEMQSVTLWSGDWMPVSRGDSIMSWKRARVTCTVEDGIVICEAEGHLYYKGLSAKDDRKLGYASRRQEPGVELTDEQLLEAYNRVDIVQSTRVYRIQKEKIIRRIRMENGTNSYWWWLALEIYAWFNTPFVFP